MIKGRYLDKLRVKPGKNVRLKNWPTSWKQTDLRGLGEAELRERAGKILDESLEHLAEAQQLLYADDRYALLIVFQAMDAAGKDGTIRHVMSGVNPQGCQVYSFKQPSSEELDHNFLWRCMKAVPERGRIGIFNRSYYEDVLVVKVHEDYLSRQRLPVTKFNKKFWRQRYDDINNFERHLVRNGTVILKFYLHISKGEQKRRFLQRLEDPKRYWKFSGADLKERGFWKDYMNAYGDAFSATSTEWAPWYIIPGDSKWLARAIVADVISKTIKSLKLKFPEVGPDQMRELAKARRQLQRE
jgi:PPK2 family polyphosphate:nucleotide phosphotransferase